MEDETGPKKILLDLNKTVDQILISFEALEDWGPSGNRPDQYNSDVVADQVIVDSLGASGYRILSEESENLSGEGLVAVVDPLDGSTNASRGLPWFATSLCVVDEHGPLVAVVADLVHSVRYEAIRGRGSFKEGEKLLRTDIPELSESIIGISGLPPHNPGWAQFRSLGAIALDLCAIADGRLDGFVDCSPDAHGIWDYLGASLVCAEAGIEVVDSQGRNLNELDRAVRRTPVAGVGDLHTELLDFRQRF
tara:strand:+ start:220 stop:969 length:750 start_codon:yes stop_codon:yes gene_type:complete